MGLIDHLAAVYQSVKLQDTRYYGTSDDIPRNKVFRLHETEYMHETWIFHPDDFANIQTQTPLIHWVHVRDAPVKIPPIKTLEQIADPDGFWDVKL